MLWVSCTEAWQMWRACATCILIYDIWLKGMHMHIRTHGVKKLFTCGDNVFLFSLCNLSCSWCSGPRWFKWNSISQSIPSLSLRTMQKSGRSSSSLVPPRDSSCRLVNAGFTMTWHDTLSVTATVFWQMVCFVSSSSWKRWTHCFTSTRTSFFCSRLRRSGTSSLISTPPTWLQWHLNMRSHVLAGTTVLHGTRITAKLGSTQASCSWTWHGSGKNILRYVCGDPYLLLFTCAECKKVLTVWQELVNIQKRKILECRCTFKTNQLRSLLSFFYIPTVDG